MNNLILIALGGAGGALLRHGVVNLVQRHYHSHFPYGTLTVNIAGSFLMGIMFVLIVERLTLHPDWRSIAMVGFLGAFTTFSTFSLDVVNLLENGQFVTALAYTLASFLLCVGSAWLAIVLTRLV